METQNPDSSERDIRQKSRYELGLLGRLFGGRRNAYLNITGFVVVCMVALMFYATIAVHSGYSGQIVTGAMSIVSLSLGYLFGARRDTE